VTTIHGNGKPGELFPEHAVFLSRDHAKRHGRRAFVYNGVNADEFGTCDRLGTAKRKNSPLFLSKTSLRTKNLRGALAIARRSGMPLTIAGGNRPLHLRIRAAFSRAHWAGPVAGSRKAKLLAEASALLFPVIWDEPFGLVMVEAMLSGTPVVASRRGSVPEIVTAETGFALDLPRGENDSEGYGRWSEALRAVQKLDPDAIRNRAIERFSHHRMAECYLDVYKRIIRGETL
jgi:glycosyltransferase involved in cell wall biosynthesis